MGAEVPIGAFPVALVTHVFGQMQHDRHRQAMVLAGAVPPGAPSLFLHVGGIDNGQPASRKAFGGDEMQQVKGIGGGRLIVLVITNQTSAEVGREHFRGLRASAPAWICRSQRGRS